MRRPKLNPGKRLRLHLGPHVLTRLLSRVIVTGGRRLEIECKAGKNQTPGQRNFGEMINRFGGLYIVAWSVADVEEALG